jgi:hypothetical protein
MRKIAILSVFMMFLVCVNACNQEWSLSGVSMTSDGFDTTQKYPTTGFCAMNASSGYIDCCSTGSTYENVTIFSDPIYLPIAPKTFNVSGTVSFDSTTTGDGFKACLFWQPTDHANFNPNDGTGTYVYSAQNALVCYVVDRVSGSYTQQISCGNASYDYTAMRNAFTNVLDFSFLKSDDSLIWLYSTNASNKSCTISSQTAPYTSFNDGNLVLGIYAEKMGTGKCYHLRSLSAVSNYTMTGSYFVKDSNGVPISGCGITEVGSPLFGSLPYYSPAISTTGSTGLTGSVTYYPDCNPFTPQGYAYAGSYSVNCSTTSYACQAGTRILWSYKDGSDSLQTVIMLANASQQCAKCIQLWDMSGEGRDLSGASVLVSNFTSDLNSMQIASGSTDADEKYCGIFDKGQRYLFQAFKDGFNDGSRIIEDICSYGSDALIGLSPASSQMNTSIYHLNVYVSKGNLSILQTQNRIRFFNCNDESQYNWFFAQEFEDLQGINCRSVYGGGYTNGSGYYYGTVDLSQYSSKDTMLVVSDNGQYIDSNVVLFDYPSQTVTVNLDYSDYPGYFFGETPYSFLVSIVDCDNYSKAVKANYTLSSKDKTFSLPQSSANNITWTRNKSGDNYKIILSASGYNFNPDAGIVWISSESEKTLCLTKAAINYANITAYGMVYDSTDSLYLPNYRVTVNCEDGSSYSVNTNSSGGFVFPKISRGITCTYSAGNDGTYSADTITISAMDSPFYVGVLYIEKSDIKTFLQQFYVKYEVVDIYSANTAYSPLEGVKVLVTCDDGESYNTGNTDGEGYASSYIPTGETCRYSASYQDYRTESDKITKNPQLIELKSLRSLNCILSGQLTKNGVGIAGISYDIYSEGSISYSGVTIDDGIYSVNLQCGADYLIVAKNGNCSVTQSQAFAPGEGGSATVSIELGTCDADKENKKESVINTIWSMATVFEWIIIAFFIFVLLAVVAKVLISGKNIVNGFWDFIDSLSGK